MGKRIIRSLIAVLLFSAVFPRVYAETTQPETREVIVTGVASIGTDQDSVYQNAVYDGFWKAFDQVRPDKTLDPQMARQNEAFKKDFVLAQKELGITDYQVLRYWQDQNRFMVELKITFGTPRVDQPRSSLLPKLAWVYQTQDPITIVSKNEGAVGVWTAQTIELVAPENGKRLQWIKTGLTPHSVYGDKYLVQDGVNLKMSNFKKFNAYNLLNYSVVYKWRVKLPNLYSFYLSDQAAYVVERSGLIKALNLENGKEKWELSAGSRAKLTQLSSKYLLLILPPNELWMVNDNGLKIWGKKFEQAITGKPKLVGDELCCFLQDGQLLSLNPDTGQTVNSLRLKLNGNAQNLNFEVYGHKLFLFYNDQGNKGHLQVFQRFTGSLLWQADWATPLTDSVSFINNQIILGTNNVFEARDLNMGLKLWEEKVSGRIKQVELLNQKLLIAADRNLYNYELR